MISKSVLKALLRQNGVPEKFFLFMSGLSVKQKADYLRIALSRTPDCPATPWAIRISDEQKEEILRTWGKKTK